MDGAVFENNVKSGALLFGNDQGTLDFDVRNTFAAGHSNGNDWDYGNGLAAYNYYRCTIDGVFEDNVLHDNRQGIHCYSSSGTGGADIDLIGNAAVASIERGIYDYLRYGYGANATFQNNQVLGSGSHGIEVYRYSSSNSEALQVSFNGNQCCDNTGKGIYTHRSSGVLGVAAEGNIACRNGDEGMDLLSTVSTEISGNQCYENGDIGMYLNSGNQMRVYENVCRDNAGRGMILDGGGPLWLCLNEIHGNGQTGLRLQSVGRSHVLYNSIYASGQNGVEANAASDLIDLNFNNIYGNYSSGTPEYYEILVNSSRAIDARRNFFGGAPVLDAYVYDRRDTGDDSVGFADVSGHAATYIPFPTEPTAMILDPADAEVLNDGIAYRIGGIALSKTEPYTVQISTDGGTTWTDIAGAASWFYDWDDPQDKIQLDNVAFRNTAGIGLQIQLEGGNGLVVYHYNRCEANGFISNNTVSGNRYGIYQYNSSGNGTIGTIIQSNTVSANAERGIRYYQYYGLGANLQFRSNIVSGTTGGHGIEVYRYSSSGSGELAVELDGNQSENNNGKGIFGTYTSGEMRINARDNTCNGNAQEGLDLRSSLSPEIHSNTSYLNGAAGLYIQSGNAMYVHQNTVHENAGNGIYVTGGGSPNLYLNEIHDNDGDGLPLASAAAGLILFNDIDVGSVNADFTSTAAVAIPSDPVARITLPVDGQVIKDNDRTVSGIAVSATRPFTVQVSIDGGTTWNQFSKTFLP